MLKPFLIRSHFTDASLSRQDESVWNNSLPGRPASHQEIMEQFEKIKVKEYIVYP